MFKVKIFVSYSRRDADFAQQIDEYFQNSGHDVFTDVKDIQAGDVWTSAIENNISNCDIFVVIITHASLRSTEVEKEILQAQRENKKIIPCFFRNINPNKIKWRLERIHGIKFSDKYELARELYSKIDIETNIPSDKSTDSIIKSSKTLEDVKTNAIPPTKSGVDKPEQKKEDLQSIPKERMGALGSGVSSIPAKTADDEKPDDTKYNSDDNKRLQQKKDTFQPTKIGMGAIGVAVPVKSTETINETKDQSTPKYTTPESNNGKENFLKNILVNNVKVSI